MKGQRRAGSHMLSLADNLEDAWKGVATSALTWLSDIFAGQQPAKGMVAVEEIGRL